MSPYRRILKNFLSLSFAEITSKALLFVSIVYLARMLGPGDFGKISFAMVVLTYAVAFSTLGFDLLGMREIAKNKTNVKKYIQDVLPVKLILAVLVFLLLAVGITFMQKTLQEKNILLLYGLCLFPTVFIFDWVFKGLEQMEWVGVAKLLEVLSYIGLILLLVKSPENILAVPLIRFTSLVISLFFLLSYFIKKYGFFSLRLDFGNIFRVFRQGLPIGLYFVMALVIYNLDVVMLGIMRSSREVGYYSAAYKLIVLITALIGVYLNALFPVISQYFKNDIKRLNALLSKAMQVMIIVVLPVALGGGGISGSILKVFYGNGYLAGMAAFRILLWTLIFVGINSLYAWALLACNRQKACVKIITVQVLMNLSLNLILIPRYGIFGAAVATLIAEGVGLPLYFFEFRKITTVYFHRLFIKPCLGVIGMLAFLFVLQGFNLFFLVPGAAICYIIILSLTGAFGRRELGLIYASIIHRTEESALILREEDL